MTDPFPTFEEYKIWRDGQVCKECGKPYKGDRGYWATETECWDCFQKRCATPRSFTPATELGEPLKELLKPAKFFCSFCGASDKEARYIVASDSNEHCICDQCVDVATEIMIEQRRADEEKRKAYFRRCDYERKAWEGTGP